MAKNFDNFRKKFLASLNQEDLGKLLLRLSSAMMLFHGFAKFNHSSMEYIKSTLTAVGLPEFIFYGVFIGEIVAPIMMIFGIASRLGGLVLAFNMVVALFLSHRTTLFNLTEKGSLSIELDVFYIVIGLCVAFFGSGKFSLKMCHRWD